jgi:NodT family efflux transporter outer membrane factor (OMF) lipoprotein
MAAPWTLATLARKRGWMWRAPLTLLLLVAGCAVGPDFARPAAPKVDSFTGKPMPTDGMLADGKAQRFAVGKKVDADWWRLFACPKLDAIISESNAHNPSLESARASLRRSQDNLRAGYGVFFPQLDAHAGVSRQKYNPAPGVLPSSEFNLFTASGTVSYTLDIWGGQRRQVEGLRAQVEQQRYTLAAATIMLSGNVVSTAIAQGGYRAEIEATEASIALEKEQLRITQAQATGGTVPFSNVLTIQSQIAATQATLPPLEEKIDQATHLLAALAGTTPGEWRRSAIRLEELTLPADLPQALPSELVRQRPDVLVAETVLHAANANIGVATAAMLPNLTLSAGMGVNNTSLGSLADPASTMWNIGAGLTQPLFHGGTLYYQRKAAIDARDQAAADYRQTVLSAFEQVADTLRAIEHDAETLRAWTEAVQTAEGALRLIQANYEAGLSTYLQVLIADGQYLQARLGYVQAVAQRLQDTASLYVALGGGWWNVPPSRVAAGYVRSASTLP